MIGVNWSYVGKVLKPKLSCYNLKFITLASAMYVRTWKSCVGTLGPILLWLYISNCDM